MPSSSGDFFHALAKAYIFSGDYMCRNAFRHFKKTEGIKMRFGNTLGLAVIAGIAGCATGASEPQAPQVSYEHNEVLAEGTMEDGTPAMIVQTAYGDASSLSVREEMRAGSQVLGGMGWKMVEQNGVCAEKELYLHNVVLLDAPFGGENTYTDLRCDGTLDYMAQDGQMAARGTDFGPEFDEPYTVLEQLVSEMLQVPLRTEEWNAERGL